MTTTAIVSGIDVTLSQKDMSESVRLWIQKLVSCENSNKNYIFARIMHDDTVFFYTEEGEPFYNEKMKLPPIMHFEKLLVGVIIYADYQDGEHESVKLIVRLFANPKESDSDTLELASFRRKMIQRYGL